MNHHPHQPYQQQQQRHPPTLNNNQNQENTQPGGLGPGGLGGLGGNASHLHLHSYQQRFVPPQFTPYGGQGGGDGTVPSPRRRRKKVTAGSEDKARRRRLYVTQQQEMKSLAAPQTAMNMWFLAIGAGAVMVVLLAVGDLLFEALWSSANDVHPHVAQLCAIIVGGGWLMLMLVFWMASRGVT
jgi:hypothetical protein